MRLYLVRPARAERRSDGSDPRRTRTLTEEGFAQARSLAEWLAPVSIETLACGPSLHCRQTLEPLSRSLGKPILVDERLERGAPADEMIDFVRELAGSGAVVCLSRSLLLKALDAIASSGATGAEVRCKRGAAWMIDGPEARATYFPPRAVSAERGAAPSSFVALPLKADGKKASSRPRTAVLDLGSTSFHLLVAEWTRKGELQRVDRKRVMLRMGSELARSPEISSDLLERSVETVRDLRAFAEKWKAQQLVAVATAALRHASNGPDVLKELEAALGGPISLLSGLEEARVVYRAIRARIDPGRKPLIGLDLGGGSLEIVVGRGEEILFEKTLPLGVARMVGEIRPADPHSQEDLRRLRRHVEKEIAPHVEAIEQCQPKRCVAVGGTARALGRLILRGQGKDIDELRGLCVDEPDLVRLGRELSEATLAERLERAGVSDKRADLLPFGAAILIDALSLLGLRSLTFCDWGLREGVLLDLLDSQAG